jgi:hypothetical protein
MALLGCVAGCGHAAEPVEPGWYGGPTLNHFSEPATLPATLSTASRAGSPTTAPARKDATAYTVWMTDAAIVRDKPRSGRAWRVQWGMTMRYVSCPDADGRTVFAATPAVDAGVTVTPLPAADGNPTGSAGPMLKARLQWNDVPGDDHQGWDYDAQDKDTVQTYERGACVVLTLHGKRLLEPGDSFGDESLNDAAGLITFALRVRADGGAYHWRMRHEQVWKGATVRLEGPPRTKSLLPLLGDRQGKLPEIIN